MSLFDKLKLIFTTLLFLLVFHSIFYYYNIDIIHDYMFVSNKTVNDSDLVLDKNITFEDDIKELRQGLQELESIK